MDAGKIVRSLDGNNPLVHDPKSAEVAHGLDSEFFTVKLRDSENRGVSTLRVVDQGVFGAAKPLRKIARWKLSYYETPISAVENSPQTAARLPQAKLDQERQRDSGQSPPRGPQAFNPRLIRPIS